MKFVEIRPAVYKSGDISYKKRELLQIIKKGQDVVIYDIEGFEATHELKMEVVFGPFLKYKTKECDLKQFLTFILSEDTIDSILSCGGLDGWLMRKKRGWND